MSNLNLQELREWVWPWPWTFKGKGNIALPLPVPTSRQQTAKYLNVGINSNHLALNQVTRERKTELCILPSYEYW